jgi:hypothetical protein
MSTHDSIPIVDDGGAFYGVPQPNLNAGVPRGGQTFIPQIPVPQPGNVYQPGYGQPAPFMPAGPQPTVRPKKPRPPRLAGVFNATHLYHFCSKCNRKFYSDIRGALWPCKKKPSLFWCSATFFPFAVSAKPSFFERRWVFHRSLPRPLPSFVLFCCHGVCNFIFALCSCCLFFPRSDGPASLCLLQMQQPQLLQNIQEIASNPIAQYGLGQASTMLRRVDVGVRFSLPVVHFHLRSTFLYAKVNLSIVNSRSNVKISLPVSATVFSQLRSDAQILLHCQQLICSQ